MASIYTQSAGEMATSIPLALALFISRHVLARGGMNVGQRRSFSQTASRFWFRRERTWKGVNQGGSMGVEPRAE